MSGAWPPAAILVALALVSCAPIPPPDILAELEQTRLAPAVVEASEFVPSVIDRAELLRADASRALEQGDFSGAQILAERARAAYELAVVVARAAKAQQSEADALGEADAIEQELTALDTAQQRVAADVTALRLRLAVVGGSGQAGAGAGAWTPADEAAAARALRLQARLLCTAARLLAPPTDPSAELAQLEQQLAVPDPPMPLSAAFALRDSCLQRLTATRRSLQTTGPKAPVADTLLEALAELAPGAVRRDERGVVVTLRRPFEGAELGSTAAATLASIGKVSRGYGTFPVLVVVHDGTKPKRSAPAGGATEAPGKLVLRALGVDGTVEMAGDAQPLLPAGRYPERNERVEVIFVSAALL